MTNFKKKNIFENFLKEDALANIKLLQIDLEKKETSKMKFKQIEINYLSEYCNKLSYKLSFNKQFRTAKVFNPITHKFGYIQKMNNTIWYGYIKKINNNSQFVKKYSLTDNLRMFKTISDMSGDKHHLSVFKTISGILELEY